MKSTFLFFVFIFSIACYSQESNFAKIKPGGVKFYLDSDSTSYFRIFSFTHIWARYTDMNPGTTNYEGEAMSEDFDIGIRRNRSGFYFHLFDRLITMTQFGISAQSYANNPAFKFEFLDLTTEYTFVKNKFTLGYGLHSWNGVARQSNVGAPHFLYIDNPGFSYPLVGTFDHSGRQLGIFAKGLLGDFEYRISLSKPFSYNALEISDTILNTAYQRVNNNYAYKGYFNYQFFDNENDVFPWKKMNYLGKRRILNLGVGVHYQPEAMKSFATTKGDTKKHDLLLLATDLFLEMPHKNNSSFTTYLVWYNYDFGLNYLKSGGLMNNGTGGFIDGQPLFQGGGNAEWSHGTGNIFHTEMGYLLPDMKWLNGKQLQFFAGYTYKNLEALACSLNNFDFGFNYFIFGNNVKCGMQYSLRPVYNGTTGDNANGEIHSYKGTLILNTQIDF